MHVGRFRTVTVLRSRTATALRSHPKLARRLRSAAARVAAFRVDQMAQAVPEPGAPSGSSPPGDAPLDAVLARIYRELLERDLDEPGERYWSRAMLNGLSAVDVAIAIATSEEYTNRIAAQRYFLPDLRELRPDRYRQVPIEASQDVLSVFGAQGPEDFDWLEKCILDFGYYNKPGIWMNEINLDKRVLAEIIADFSPERPLELGCSTGGVLKCLLDLGIRGDGLEISSRAKQDAYPEVRSAIHLGDLLTTALSSRYDLVFGLDVFEHLNPNRLGRYIGAIREALTSSGWLFCNIPAFGHDDVFGEVFPLTIASWKSDSTAGRRFTDLHVDEHGYPMHGHLIWAGTTWWVEQFERAGFHRQREVERALHGEYDRFFETHAPARKSFFVFSPTESPPWQAVVARIREMPSGAVKQAMEGRSPAEGADVSPRAP